MRCSTSERPLIHLLAAMALVSTGTATAQQRLRPRFDPPWTGYDVGSSAYPGNPAPFERDPTAIAIADFDGDQRPDVAVANYEYAAPGGGTDGRSGFAVLFKRRDGKYGRPVHTTVSKLGCWDVVAADFDEDGDQDVAVSVADAFYEGQTVRIYYNDGQGAFPSFAVHAVVGGPIGLAAADFDGDGHVDLAVVNFLGFAQTAYISILRNDGAGALTPQVTYEVGSSPWKLEAGDIDGDGSVDLAVAHVEQRVSILLNAGDGTFGAPLVYDKLFPQQGGMMFGCVALADADRDGDLDVFYGNTRSNPLGQSGKVVHLRNEGGSLTRLADIPLMPFSAGPAALAAGDLDGDQWPDLVAIHFSGRPGDGPQVLSNDGAGGFLPADPIPAGQASFDVSLADVDGDGRLDLLTADRFSMMVTVHRNRGAGPRTLATHYATASINIRMDVGDVDGDGDLDVLTSTESMGSEGALLRNLGDGSFAPPVLYTHSEQYGSGVARGKLRDLDGDGDLDLLYNDAHSDLTNNSYDFYVALNDGAGVFGPIVRWVLGTCGNGDVDAFDLDGDGDLDVVNLEELACGGGGGNRLFISRNRGDATFDPAYLVQIDTGPHAVVGGDFDGDGKVDLVTAHWMPYGLRDFLNVHIGNGDGTFQEEVLYQVGQGPRWIVAADLDGDGDLDLATANSGSGNDGRETLTVLFGTGMGTFSGRRDYAAPFSPDLIGATGLASGDVDWDGDLDLLMTTVAGGMALYRNDGTGEFTIGHRLGLSWDPWSVVSADLSNDGIPDLVALTSDGVSGLGRFLTVLPAASLWTTK